MGLTDDLKAIEPAGTGGELLFHRVMARLTEEEQAAFLAALDDAERVSAPALSRTLRSNGHKVGPSTIRAWRRGESR